MDGADVPQDEFTACMKDLAQVNTLTLTRPPTLSFIGKALAAAPADRHLTILDVGFGAGDMLRAIHLLCERKERHVRLIGLDLNPRSEKVARELTEPSSGIEFRTGNLYDWPPNEPVDIVISSLVTHHMDDDEIIRFLRWMEGNAKAGWFVNDLHRHWLAYHSFRLLSTIMRWHHFVRHDGLISVARAFRRNEWVELLGRAGMADVPVHIRWVLPFRYCLARRKW